MPAGEARRVRKFSRAAEVILVTQDGVAFDLSGYTSVAIEAIVAGVSTFYVRGTDAECTWFTDGADGKVQYNPPSGGWTLDTEIVVWLETNGVYEDFPGDEELEYRVRTVGSTDPAV